MSNETRIFGAENSPYSVKVRSYFRYKGIPHQWIVRNSDAMEEFKRHAKLPLIPLVVEPDGHVMQDSTPIVESTESRHPEPAIGLGDECLDFISALLEEFGDEWGNKWMFHYRWAREADQIASSQRLAGEMVAGLSPEQVIDMARGIVARMLDRVWFVGSSAQTAPQIEASWAQAIALLEPHLETRPFLFGARPALADFGLWPQFYNASLDPTPGALLRERGPSVMAWIDRMLEPKAEGEFEAWASLSPSLLPFLKSMCGGLFLPWSDANARALEQGAETYDFELAGHLWTQKPTKYQAKSLAELRRKYAAVSDKGALDEILEAADCLRWLRD